MASPRVTSNRPADRRSASFLMCPNCGLHVRMIYEWVAIEHCPRCVARSQSVVRLLPSPPPLRAREYLLDLGGGDGEPAIGGHLRGTVNR
jgi:hypothetical protein